MIGGVDVAEHAAAQGQCMVRGNVVVTESAWAIAKNVGRDRLGVRARPGSGNGGVTGSENKMESTGGGDGIGAGVPIENKTLKYHPGVDVDRTTAGVSEGGNITGITRVVTSRPMAERTPRPAAGCDPGAAGGMSRRAERPGKERAQE